MSRFQNSLYLGDIQARVAVLRETGQCKLTCTSVMMIADNQTPLRTTLPRRTDLTIPRSMSLKKLV
jgi:hypothetical protein